MADTSKFFTQSASKIVLVIGIITFFTRVSRAIEYETINNPSNSAQFSTSNSNSRTLGGGSYYNEPNNAHYAEYYPSYSNGNALKREASDSYAAPAASSYGQYGMTGEGDKGDEDSGIYGLIGLLGLLGLVPSLLPILGPLLGLLLLLLLPILLPIIGPLLLPLLLIIALPLLILFLPVPVVTVPSGGGRTTTSGINGGLDMETARMIYDAIGRDECIERYTCEMAHRARGFGINTEKIYGFFLGKKQLPTSPKWIHSIARGFKHSDDCKSYTCSAKLF